MKSIKAKRQQSSGIIFALSLLGIVLAPTVERAAYDTVLTFQALMALAMLVGIIGLLED